jgi:cAMP phosphodiesterase
VYVSSRVCVRIVCAYSTTPTRQAILLECSWTDGQSANQLYGHLTPLLFMEEMHTLDRYTRELTSDPTPLRGLTTMVTHIKPETDIQVNPLRHLTSRQQIQRELSALNTLELDLIYPSQGERFELGTPA